MTEGVLNAGVVRGARGHVGFMTDGISRTGGGGDMHADVIYRLKIWIGLCFCILKHLYVGGRGVANKYFYVNWEGGQGQQARSLCDA